MNRCLGTKRDNSPCTVAVEPPQAYCWWHDPANAEQRKQAASRGGKRAGRGRPQVELADIKQRLSGLADNVLDDTVDKGKGAVVSQILNVYLRALSVELKLREQEEILERVAELEALMEQQRQGGRRGA
jgi:hypothetical protein